MGSNAAIRMHNFSISYDWFIRFDWLEGNGDILKFHCIDANTQHGYEYSFNGEVFTIKKRVAAIKKK